MHQGTKGMFAIIQSHLNSSFLDMWCSMSHLFHIMVYTLLLLVLHLHSNKLLFHFFSTDQSHRFLRLFHHSTWPHLSSNHHKGPLNRPMMIQPLLYLAQPVVALIQELPCLSLVLSSTAISSRQVSPHLSFSPETDLPSPSIAFILQPHEHYIPDFYSSSFRSNCNSLAHIHSPFSQHSCTFKCSSHAYQSQTWHLQEESVSYYCKYTKSLSLLNHISTRRPYSFQNGKMP